MTRRLHRTFGSRGQQGQASLLVLGVLAVLLAGVVVLFAFGSALGSKGRHQRGADLAAVSAAQVMRDLYPRLFEPPVLANGLPNPRHLPLPVYLARARAAAVRGGRRNDVKVAAGDVSFGASFAPTRVTVALRGEQRLRLEPGPAPVDRVISLRCVCWQTRAARMVARAGRGLRVRDWAR